MKLIVSFLVSAFIIMVLVSSVFAEGKVRVISSEKNKVAAAVSQGCKVVREAKNLKSLSCSAHVAQSLGLQEDIRLFAVDADSNSQIQAAQVHASGNLGTGRIVVVLDTGYNYNHPDLASSYSGGKDFVNNDNDPYDDNGHGSHVAGIITGDGIDSKAKGVAPGTSIVAGKVLDANGAGFFSDIVAAIYWAVDGPDGVYGTADDINADAISLSLGTSRPYTYKGYCDNAMPDLTEAIKYATEHGVAVVAAAGNNGNAGISIPGCISYAITVGAVDRLDKTASFSSRGKSIDVVAPGVNIYSTWLTGYKILSGTSMATPMVTGTIALIKAAHPEYSYAQAYSGLIKTVKDLGKPGFDSDNGWGRINAYAAVNFMQ